MSKRFLTMMLCIIVIGQCLPLMAAAETAFTDVMPDAYYAEEVEWAVSNGITFGTTDTTFSPGMVCTRSQAVTFLWNASGKPEPTGTDMPFTDVAQDQWYCKAVLWAVEKGITDGTTPTTFSPDMKCSRSQIVTFLWNVAGKPVTESANPFTDIKEDAWYYNAVMWAAGNGITAGTTPDTFSPDMKCDRAQIVCFLERYYNNTDALLIASQPADFYMDSSEEDAVFSVEIAGGVPNYYYEWYVEGELKATHGGTSATSDSFVYHVTDYDFDNVQGLYLDVKCVVTDIEGTVVTSDTAKLYAKEATQPLAVSVQPVSYQMTSSMEDATFTVEITGGTADYYYYWYILKDNDETKISHGPTNEKQDTLTYTFSDYDFDDYIDIAVYCVITDHEGNTVSTKWAEVLQK